MYVQKATLPPFVAFSFDNMIELSEREARKSVSTLSSPHEKAGNEKARAHFA